MDIVTRQLHRNLYSRYTLNFFLHKVGDELELHVMTSHDTHSVRSVYADTYSRLPESRLC